MAKAKARKSKKTKFTVVLKNDGCDYRTPKNGHSVGCDGGVLAALRIKGAPTETLKVDILCDTGKRPQGRWRLLEQAGEYATLDKSSTSAPSSWARALEEVTGHSPLSHSHWIRAAKGPPAPVKEQTLVYTVMIRTGKRPSKAWEGYEEGYHESFPQLDEKVCFLDTNDDGVWIQIKTKAGKVVTKKGKK